MALYFLVSGLGAWFAAFTLAREGYQLALNGTTPSCNINPFFSCGSVMQSPQATLFFDTPNQLFGVAGYIAVAMVGAAMLSGATLRRTFWVIFTLGILGAYIWLMWMFVQAVFVIGFLCLYCMVVWAIHIPLWWIFLPWAMKQGMLSSSPAIKKAGALWLPYSWVMIVINHRCHILLHRSTIHRSALPLYSALDCSVDRTASASQHPVGDVLGTCCLVCDLGVVCCAFHSVVGWDRHGSKTFESKTS